jgi:hypothetical protein
MRWGVAAVCGYETAAICSRGHLPMVTTLCVAHPVISVIIVTGLIAHLRLAWLAGQV